MYTLYYSPGACSMAVHVALIETKAPFQLQKIDTSAGQNRGAEYLKINPRGQVPVLVDDGRILREGAAILIYLLEKEKNPLLPRDGDARTDALEWLMYCNASLHPAYGRMFFLMHAPADATAKAPLIDAATANINKMWQDVEQRLATSPYLAGSQLTMADILLTVIANWSARMPKPITIGPNVKRLLQEVIARPAYKQAMDTEQVEYKVAA